MTGARKVGIKWQGYFGSAGPGQTRCFATEREAAAWAFEMRSSYRNMTKRKSRVLPVKAFDRKVKLPVGVTYSHGKWYARSPGWYRWKVSKVFTENHYGERGALSKALTVAKRWLKEI